MSGLSSIRTFLGFLFRRSSIEREMEEELGAHLRSRAEDLESQGLSRAEAERQAWIEFGGYQRYKEECREALGTRLLRELASDVRYGLRVLRKSPGFTAVAVLTVTLGIGATTAIFSVVDAVLLRPLPYRDSNRLVSLYEDRSSTGFPRKEFTPANYADCKEQKQIFKDVAAVDADRSYDLTGKGAAPERLWADGVSWNLFSILGTRPLLGRVFQPEEDMPGSNHVVLISYRLWRGRFGSDSNVVGQDISLDGVRYWVVGVMPAGFSFPDGNADLWVPIAFTPRGLADRGSHFLTVIAALRPGVSVARANAELRVFSQNLRRQHMDIMRFVDSFVAVPLHEVYTGNVRAGLIVLLLAVTLILLIACANIANLLLSRAAVRQREIALRVALGAPRVRIVRQLLTESTLLAVAGGVLGILFAAVSFSFLKCLIPSDLSRTISLTLNPTVLGVTILISFVSAFLFGLAPALRISKADVNVSLKEGGRGSTFGRRKGLGDLLVAAEMALSLLLLVTSGLLLQSFEKLRSVDPGFLPDHVLTLEIPASWTVNPGFTRRTQFFQTILERVRTLPGVKIAALTSDLPLTWKSGMADFLPMAGFLPEGAVRARLQYAALDRVVSPGYFEAMRIPLLHGRLFDDRDGPDAPLVAIINETMARKFWPHENALDKRFRLNLGGGGSRLFQIVGIVGDVKQMGLDVSAKEEMYFPCWQAQGNYEVPNTLVLRATRDPLSLASAVRQVVWSIDPNQPVSNVMTMNDALDRVVQPRRVQALLLGGLAALALTLACVGIYGVMAYLVAQQTHEIGIRMALGADRGNVFRLIVGRGAKLTATGVGIGIVGALGLTQFLRGILYGVKPTDPLTFAVVSFILIGVALLACYIPARRATKVDPMEALRYE